jgi:AraC family transcriptional regulator
MDSILTVGPPLVATSPSEIRALVMSVVTLLDTAKREIDISRAAARASILRASMLLRVEIDRQTPIDSQDSGGRLLAWQSGRVREYMDAHLGGRILVSDLSKVAQRSPAHFARAFKLTFGRTPHAYLMQRRVEAASHLMRVSDRSLSDIAVACGFTDQAHLCRLFRQRMGRSPAAWRRERCASGAIGLPAL